MKLFRVLLTYPLSGFKKRLICSKVVHGDEGSHRSRRGDARSAAKGIVSQHDQDQARLRQSPGEEIGMKCFCLQCLQTIQ